MKQSARAFFANARQVPGLTTEPFARALAAAALAGILVVLGTAPEGKSATVDLATQTAAKSLEVKLQILESKDSLPSASYRALIITEYEANSYLKVHSGEFLPVGVRTPSLRVQPEHATASADVDFDALSRSYPNPNDWGPKVLAAMFKGTQHVTVTAKVQSENAGVRMQIESVVVGSLTVPSWLVDYVIQNVLQPRYNFDLSKPLPYPDHVTQIVLGSVQATFLRGPTKGGSRQ
ncbi:MAG TPA: hypothetical protein VKO18_17205 [Terriglobia bacterium]|nr:hypothetical protein [Terriglobia bacterium]